MKEILYIGEVTWHEAIELAESLGMILPNAELMIKIYRFMSAQDGVYPSIPMTSTPYQYNTDNYVLPVDLPIETLQDKNSTFRDSKDTPRKCYLVPKDMTETDIDTFNFRFNILNKP